MPVSHIYNYLTNSFLLQKCLLIICFPSYFRSSIGLE
jgi:hypothetical protein